MEEYKKYVTIKKTNDEKFSLNFVDFKQDDIENVGIFTKNIVFTETDKSKIKDLLIGKIISLSNMNILDEKTKNVFSFKNCEESKYKTKLNNASYYIAVEGKIGKATNILLSEKNYNKYNLKDICVEMNLNILFDDTVEDIYLYRINSIEQPGLVLVFNDDKYELIPIGFFPEKFFIKISL